MARMSAEDFALVREGIYSLGLTHREKDVRNEAQSALDRLEARLVQAEHDYVAAKRERDERMTRESGLVLIEDSNQWREAYCKARDDLRAAEARLAEVERERDELQRALESWKQGPLQVEVARAKVAEARVVELEQRNRDFIEQLRRIPRDPHDDSSADEAEGLAWAR